jgi:hypothetical protein
LAAIALVALFFLWRHRRRQVRDPDHPRQSTWKSYRDATVFLGGIPGYARDQQDRNNHGNTAGRGRSSPEGYSNQPFLSPDGGPSSSLNKLTPTGQSQVSDDYGFDARHHDDGLEQDVELSPYMMHDSGFDSPTSPTPMRGLGGVASPSRYSSLDRSGSPRSGRHLDPNDGEESLAPTLPSPIAGTTRSSPLRLVDADDRMDPTSASSAYPPSRGVSEKARRHSQFLRAERPTTIVQHSDAGIVEDTEGTSAGPEGIM